MNCERLHFIEHLREFEKNRKPSTVNNYFFILLAAVIFGLAVSLYAADEAQLVKGFRYPDYDEQGKLSFELFGDEAQILADGLIQIKNLKIFFYEDGKIMTRVTTPWCMFNRVTRIATSTSSVCIARSEIVLTGTGFEWGADEGGFKIKENAKVILRNVRERPNQEKR